MTSIEFKAWPKIARFNKPMVVTEKLDGTNAAIGIRLLSEFVYQKQTFVNNHEDTEPEYMDGLLAKVWSAKLGMHYGIYAQSRTRIITPGKGTDNYGFAQWVQDNAGTLVADLGPGLHYGEWWGNGIQRNYGLDHKRFSLFNVAKWEDVKFETPNVDHVPVLAKYEFDTTIIRQIMGQLKTDGSRHPLALGHRAEGVVVYHSAAGVLFKYLLDNPDTPKNKPRDTDGNVVAE